MNDRFKFRGIHPILGELQEIKFIDFIHNTVDFGDGDVFNIEDVKIQQATGLKDKNGKLIYEGDVVNGSCGVYWGKMIVEYNVAGFVLNKNGKYLKFLEGDNFIEVIGNKFENIELLKECE